MSSSIESLVNREYQYGFVTDIESDTIPPGLSEDVVRLDLGEEERAGSGCSSGGSRRYRRWLTMKEPHWPNVTLRARSTTRRISYYSAPKTKKPLGSLDEVDPELLRDVREARHSARTSRRCSPASRSTRSSTRVSVGTTMQGGARRSSGSSSARSARRCASIPSSCEKYLGSVVPHSDNFFAALNAAVFTDGSFVYVPKGVRCPMELSTYFRINAADTGQFERTLIVADEGAYVSYLEGCTAPKRDTNQLHAAVVELVALEDATIKYSTVQNWYAGDKDGVGGIYNFVTKRGKCAGENSKISWTQVETGSAITWKYPSVILQGDNSVGEFYSRGGREQPAAGRHGHEDDPHRPQHEVDHRLEGHLGRRRATTVSRPGAGAAEGGGRAQLHAVRLDARRQPLRRAHVPVHRGRQQHGDRRARGVDVEDRRGPDLLPQAARARAPSRRCR